MPRFSVLPLLLLLVVLLVGCGGGGASVPVSDPNQPDPEAFKIVLINCLPGRALDFWDSDVTEPGNSPNYFGTIEDELATPEGFAEILDPVQVQGVLASATPTVKFDITLHLLPLGPLDGSPIYVDINVEHGLGSLYLKLVPNPEPVGDVYVGQVITEAEFEQMLSDGSIQGVLGL